MDGSLPPVSESTAPRPVGPRRDRPRREDGPAFRLPDERPSEDPAVDGEPPSREAETRPVAPREEGEPGTRLDVSG